jgi:hypothetical protein
MSTTASTITIIATLVGLLGIQAFWITRTLDALGVRMENIERRLDRLEQRLDDMFRVLLEHGERIGKLEERI